MARKLNKKVAIIGSIVFMVFVVLAVIVVLHLSRDPEKFIADGESAREAGDYEAAIKNFHRAKARVKDDRLRVDLLYKIIDLYVLTEQWPQTRGSWNEVIKLDPENLPIRYIQLKYYYSIADSGAYGLFGDVESQASELLEIVEKRNLLEEPTSQWESQIYKDSGLEHQSLTGQGESQKIGPYLHIVRGRARYEQARMGSVTDPEQVLEQAIADLQKGHELDPMSIAAAWYEAQAILLKGQMLASKGMLEQREKSLQQAIEIISDAVSKVPDDPQGHIYLLLMKQQAEASKSNENLAEDWLEKLEPGYLELSKKFPSEPRIYAIMANLYRAMGPKYINKAIVATEKARDLDPNSIGYVFVAADLRYLKYTIQKDIKDLKAAIEMLQTSIDSPSVNETTGPRQMRNINNKATLYSLLATIYTEQLIFSDTYLADSEKQIWMQGAEEAVHHIEQILQSGEDPVVIKWQGMLDLAKGNRYAGIKKLYTAYQQLKAAKREDTQLAYVLAKAFENSTELGAANEFWAVALRFRDEDKGRRDDSIDKKKPESLLDWAQLWLKFRNYGSSLNLISFHDTVYGASNRSKMLRINTLIESGEFDKAKDEIESAQLDEPNEISLKMVLLQRQIRNATVTIERERLDESSIQIVSETKEQQISPNQLRAQIKEDYAEINDLIERLLRLEPNLVPEATVVLVCNYYREAEQNEIARSLATEYLDHFPDNINVKLLLGLLDAGPEASEQSVSDLRLKILEQIPDIEAKNTSLGIFYSGKNEPNKAIECFSAVLAPYMKNLTTKEGSSSLSNYASMTSAGLLDEYLKVEQYQLADKVAELARIYNIDGCGGQYFKARIALTRGDYEKALQFINGALDLRPVFSEGYALKARVCAAQGKEEQSLQNLKTAIFLNPLSGVINKAYAISLYERNEKLGGNITSDQKIEFMQALQRAINFSPNDLLLLGFYADYLGTTEPQKAVSIRQKIFTSQPNIINAVQLGKLASRIAESEQNEKQKQAYYDIAESAFQEALKLEPTNTVALYSYTEYQRSRGQYKQAEQVLDNVQDKRLLGQHYFDTGQYDKAKEVFQEIEQNEPDNSLVLRALLAIAQRTQNQEDIKHYSEKLISADDSVEHNLMQVQSYLSVGLIKDAELKLQSFREKYPQEPRAQLLEAWVYMSKGQLQKALELTNKSLEINESNPVGWQLKGQINRLLANYNQAVIDLEKSKSLKDDPQTRMELSRAYMSVNRQQDAVLELAAIMDKETTPLKARLLLEQIYYSSGNIGAMRNFYSRMMQMFPDDIMWLNKTAMFASGLKDYDTALNLYKQALDKSAQSGKVDITAVEGYLNTLLNQNKLDKVISEGSKYIDSPVAPMAFIQMAQAKLKMNDRQAAIEYSSKAVDASGNDQYLAASVLKIMYTILGGDEVKKYCNKKLEQKPDDLATNYALYRLSQVEKDYNKATSYLDKMIEIVGPQTNEGKQYRSDKAQLLFLAYNVYSDNSYINRSVDILESLIEEMPENPAILNNYAYNLAYADQKLDKALTCIKKAIEQSPDNPGLTDTYAYVLYKNGRFSEAEEQAQASVQQFELKEAFAPAEVYEHLAVIKEKLEKTDEAVAFYNKALEAGKRTYSQEKIKEIQKIIERLSR